MNSSLSHKLNIATKMAQQVLQTFLTYFLVYVFAFEDLIYVHGEENREMIEHGRVQYQLLKEKGNLPQYGPCWKAAVEHLNEGCRHLSEETQSDIALHITNCFLKMSGHETYNCELDKKPNLRAICINSMSDRAFNVYTEFYTHTQNICWFLRGQIWHETIAENTIKVGKQLEVTAENQEGLLQAQKESLELQERMLQHGKFLEHVLEDLYLSSKAHQELLKVMSQSVSNLQSWIVGEVSWFDSIIFYGMTIFFTFILTSPQRTMSARLPIFFLLFFNLLIERMICSSIIYNNDEVNAQNLYNNIYDFVWYSRYGFVFLSAFILIYRALFHKDLAIKNNELLNSIQEQNNSILDILENLRNKLNPSKLNYNMISENLDKKSYSKQNNLTSDFSDTSYKSSNNGGIGYKDSSYFSNLNGLRPYREGSVEDTKENNMSNSRNSKRKPLREYFLNSRYNLRSRTETPDPI